MNVRPDPLVDVRWSIAGNLIEIPPDKNNAYFVKIDTANSHKY